MKPSEMREYLKAMYEIGLCVYIEGAPGVGKSSIVGQVAEEKGAELIDIRLAQMDPTDIRGIPVHKEGRTFWAPPSCLPQDDGRSYIVFFDELGAAPPLNQVAVYQALTDHRIGEYVFPKQCVIWAAGNRLSDRAVVYKMSTALANRLTHTTLDVDTSDWIAWALTHDIRDELISFHRFRDTTNKSMLFSFDPKREEKAHATPRTWEMVSKILNSGLRNGLLEAAIFGTVGEPCGVEFVGWLRVHKSMPNPDMVILNPKTAPVPEQPDVMCALIGALVARANENTIDSLIVYADHIPEEFSMLMIKDALTKDPSLANTSSFAKWAINHREALGA